MGTMGGRRAWQNPHLLGVVQCMSSSLGQGRPEDLSGRLTVNCRTLNEPFSFFGVDLGQGRYLQPTCYSIKNRNSMTHVLLNWHFEGSNDRINWFLLDRRIYLSDDPEFNEEMEEEHKALC